VLDTIGGCGGGDMLDGKFPIVVSRLRLPGDRFACVGVAYVCPLPIMFESLFSIMIPVAELPGIGMASFPISMGKSRSPCCIPAEENIFIEPEFDLI
jgi:hypothetical protein